MSDRQALTQRSNPLAAMLTFGAAALVGSAAHGAVLSGGIVTEDWSGADGDAWSSEWTQRGDHATVQIQDGRGEVSSPTAEGYLPNLLNIVSVENSDQRVTLAVGNGSSQLLGGLVARAHDETDTFYVVRVGMRTPANESLGIYKYVDGSATQLVENSVVLVRGAQTKLRFVVETNDQGTTDLRVKLWALEEDEPDDWTLEVLGDATPELQGVSGRIGTWSQFNNTGSYYTNFDNYSAVVPEPASLALGLAALGMVLPCRRRPRD